jgi:hypothetical protein
MSSIFTGLGDLYRGSGVQQPKGLQQLKTFPGQVVEICMDENHSLYESPRDIGKIIFRDLVYDYNRAEKELTKQAFPLDRSIARYPLPGEEVIIYRAFGEATGPAALVMANLYFYSFVVSAMHNITSNVNPFMGTDKYSIDKTNPLLSYDQAKKRFDKKLKSKNLVKGVDDKLKIYHQLAPEEGDFILQGRFGNSIRFGSTKAKLTSKNEWSEKGVEGDGIMVFRVNNDTTSDEKTMLKSEVADKDDALIYMCTTQNVPITLACSLEMKTWRTRYNLDPKRGGSSEIDRLKTGIADTSEFYNYQKIPDDNGKSPAPPPPAGTAQEQEQNIDEIVDGE